MLKIFKLLTECKERAEQAIAQSETDAAAYREALGKNNDAHDALMQKIDRRTGPRESAA